MLKTETLIRVRYAETDQMGFAYHSNYLIWMEVARIHMLDAWGITYRSLEEQGYLLPVLEAELKYRFPARFDDRVAVVVSLRERPGVRWKLLYEMYRVGDGEEQADRELLLTGSTTHAFIDRSGRAVKPPSVIQDFFRKANFGESNDENPVRTPGEVS